MAESRKKRKDAQLLIRIPLEDRDRFIALCEDMDTSAAREIRRFIRHFIETHAGNDRESR